MTCQEKQLRREEKREAKCRRREEKREAKFRRREEKREAKHRRREEKRQAKRLCEDLWNGAALLFSPTTSEHHSNNNNNNVVVGYPNNSNVRFNNFSGMSPERIEQDVATLRTMFPDCDPNFIRNCLAVETEDHLQRVAEKLLRTDYPKVAPASPLTPPTAPPLPVRNSLEFPYNDEAPPPYEQALLQPPPLPKRHQRSSSWNGTSNSSPRSHNLHNTHNSHQSFQSFQSRSANVSAEMSETINTTVKNLFATFKPSTVENAYQKYNYIWARPISNYFNPQSFSQPSKVIPKDKQSIQKGFNPDYFPTRELHFHDITAGDWNGFINGLNSLIGVNSVYGVSNNFGEGFSVGLKWVSWMNVTMDEKLMESNIAALNEFITKCNESFFIPRRIVVQLIDDRNPKPVKNSFGFKKKPTSMQYLLVKSI